MAALAVVPQSLGERVAEVDLIAETVLALDETDELSPELYEQLQTRLVRAISGTRAKVDNVAAALAGFPCSASACAAEIKRLTARKARLERADERLRTYVIMVADSAGVSKLEGNTATLRVQRNPPAVIVDDATQIPAAFMRQPKTPAPAPDLIAIKAELQRNIDIPGCRLHAGQRLVIS